MQVKFKNQPPGVWQSKSDDLSGNFIRKYDHSVEAIKMYRENNLTKERIYFIYLFNILSGGPFAFNLLLWKLQSTISKNFQNSSTYSDNKT